MLHTKHLDFKHKTISLISAYLHLLPNIHYRFRIKLTYLYKWLLASCNYLQACVEQCSTRSAPWRDSCDFRLWAVAEPVVMPRAHLDHAVILLSANWVTLFLVFRMSFHLFVFFCRYLDTSHCWWIIWSYCRCRSRLSHKIEATALTDLLWDSKAEG